ncbi:hypothetical protein PIB30_005786 [Stylosanthes scabra]|uniref:Uncharacterized protein n=1 Tax=Stylosanthes scabra TaxID=79078 RepID=A0ABU6X4U6_9FABA|nr:hypothetical protein [Stylosanthes scabra]
MDPQNQAGVVGDIQPESSFDSVAPGFDRNSNLASSTRRTKECKEVFKDKGGRAGRIGKVEERKRRQKRQEEKRKGGRRFCLYIMILHWNCRGLRGGGKMSNLMEFETRRMWRNSDYQWEVVNAEECGGGLHISGVKLVFKQNKKFGELNHGMALAKNYSSIWTEWAD